MLYCFSAHTLMEEIHVSSLLAESGVCVELSNKVVWMLVDVYLPWRIRNVFSRPAIPSGDWTCL